MNFSNFSNRSRRAFTLVELMISVALVVVLMLAVTQIFSIASKTMGGSQALATAVRDSQAAQTVFARDLAAAAPDGACFIIHNTRRAVWRNKADLLGTPVVAGQQDPLNLDLDDDLSTPELSYSVFDVNFRNHRLDHLMFYARDQFPRQTGTDKGPDLDRPLIAEMSSREAAIFYHHLSLPTNTGSFNFQNGSPIYPGYGTPETNDNNFFATQWTLGRVAMLLVPPNPNPVSGLIYDKSLPNPFEPNATPTVTSIANQNYYRGPAGYGAGGSVQMFSRGNYPRYGGTDPVESGRFDLVGSSITEIRSQLKSEIESNTLSGPVSVRDEWWKYMMSWDTRFQAMPYYPQPLTTSGLAKTSPIFVPACTQFCVEFAGDFVVQDWDPNDNGTPDEAADVLITKAVNPSKYYGRVTGPGTDGRVDRVYMNDSNSVGSVRWYGLPRDTDGDGRIVGARGDVVPVRDVAGVMQSFERVPLPTTASPANPYPTRITVTHDPTTGVRTDGGPIPAVTGDYLHPNTANTALGITLLGAIVTSNPEYMCAWGPTDTNRPKMIRIVMAIDRPEAEGKLPDGQTFEYIYNVGH